MNYIRQLQNENLQLTRQLNTLRRGIDSLREYMAHPKFSCGDRLDGYVNVADVLLRLRRRDERQAEVDGVRHGSSPEGRSQAPPSRSPVRRSP